MMDASSTHVGAALQQRDGPAGAWQPLGFFSQKLSPTQQRYSAYDRELLACVLGIRHFRFMLEGRAFTLYIDHRPLTFAPVKGGGGVDSQTEQAPELHHRVHQQHQAHRRGGQRGG